MPHAGVFELFATLGVVSKVILVVLLLFSVSSWAFIFQKWRAFRRCEGDEQRFLGLYAKAPEKEEFRRHTLRYPASPSAAMFLAVMDRAAPEGDGFPRERFGTGPALEPSAESPGLDREYLSRVVAYIMQDQISRLEAYLPFLATTGNITPFIGLLGTVMGIINAFMEIGTQGTASIAAVAPGVAEALVATAAGLFTAIPAVIAYNYFLSRIRRIAFRAEAFGIELLHSLQARTKPVEVRG